MKEAEKEKSKRLKNLNSEDSKPEASDGDSSGDGSLFINSNK